MKTPCFPDAPLRDMGVFLNYAVETYEATDEHLLGLLADSALSKTGRHTLTRVLIRTRRNLARYRRYVAEQNQRDLAEGPKGLFG